MVGPQFRRVDLTGSPRGGVLTQGSVLTVSSYATRTSPVLRGKWILDNLLNAPPPDPPANVPNLDDSAIGTAHSMRQQLEAHRKDPTCAACHRRMDPLGFGLENFDAVGAWRSTDGKFPIDASGFLPDGDEFNGPDELRTILEGQKEAFARCLTSKLLIYSLGRGLERYDRGTVKGIAARLPLQGYRSRVARPRHRQEPALPVAAAGHRDRSAYRSPMIITRQHLHRRMFLKGMGARDRTADARRDDSGVRGAAPIGIEGDAPGFHLRAQWHHHAGLDAEGCRGGLRVHAHPEAARGAAPRHDGDFRPVAEEWQRAR